MGDRSPTQVKSPLFRFIPGEAIQAETPYPLENEELTPVRQLQEQECCRMIQTWAMRQRIVEEIELTG
jgi:hypothetical protein